MSYTLDMFYSMRMTQALDSRKLGGYFSTVISVHPLAGLYFKGRDQFGPPRVTVLDKNHIFIEGKIGVKSIFRIIPPLNFFLSQINLILAIISIAKKNKIEFVRVGDPYYLGLIGLFVSKILKVPLVIRVCSRYDDIVCATNRPIMPRLFFFRVIEKFIERKVFPRCDLVAGANEDNLHYAIENGANKLKGTVFRYGNLIHQDHWIEPNIREKPTAEITSLGLCGKLTVMTVSRLEPMKYVDHTIRAVAELVRRGISITGVIIGSGSMKKELESLVFSLGIAESIVFAGNRDQSWISRILPYASVIISPQMGRALTESALAAVPLVAYDYDWQREVVIDGLTGYLVPHKDWLKLAEKTEYLLKNPILAKEIGQNARKKIIHMMDPVKLEQNEISEYEKLKKYK